MSLKYLGNVRLVVTVFAKFSHLFMFLAWRCTHIHLRACAGWSEPLLCSPAVHVLDGASLCSALRLCMCWMEGAFALLSGCGCAGWSEPLLCSPAVHVLDGGSLCSALRLWLCWMERAFALLSGCSCAGWREPLLCSPAVACWMGGAFALLSGCGCAW